LGRLGPRVLLAPALEYAISYRQYECARCLEACPSGALAKMSLDAKKLLKIGDATLAKERCIVFTQKTKCGACHHACPAKPERAFSVAGLAVHRAAERPTAALLGAPAERGAPGAGPAPSPGEEGFPF
jgi:epoxyqueuosine reductase QueG